MSTKTSLEGQRYYQLGIAVNPGNSGGPVFNSYGAVIGVVTRKSAAQEALAFCIPVEDLNLAIDKVVDFPEDADRAAAVAAPADSRGKRARAAARRFTASGSAVGAIARRTGPMTSRKADFTTQPSPTSNGKPSRGCGRKWPGSATMNLFRKRFAIRSVSSRTTLKSSKLSTRPPARARAKEPLASIKATHCRLLVEVCKALSLEIPINILIALGDESEKGNKSDASKNGSTKPGTPNDHTEKPDLPPNK